VAALFLSIVTTGIVVWTVRPGVPSSTPASLSVPRLVVVPPEPLPIATEGALTFSPDGRQLAYVAGIQGRTRLYVRDIDQFESRPIPGTEGADSPRFSPDGKWVAFTAERKLKKVAITGGAVTTVADFTEGRGLTWGPDNTILFNLGRASGIWQVSAGGGKPTAVSTLREKENEHDFPEVLPDGKALLFSANGLEVTRSTFKRCKWESGGPLAMAWGPPIFRPDTSSICRPALFSPCRSIRIDSRPGASQSPSSARCGADTVRCSAAEFLSDGVARLRGRGPWDQPTRTGLG